MTVQEGNSKLLASPNNSSILQSYLVSVRQLTGSMTVSLLIPSKSTQGFEKIIVHEGEMPPVAEFVSDETVDAFLERIQVERPRQQHGLLSLYNGRKPHEYVLRISITDFVQAQNANDLHSKRRKIDTMSFASGDDETIWLGFRFDAGQIPAIFQSINVFLNLSFSDLEFKNFVHSPLYTLALGGYMVWQNFKFFYALQDSVSKLPGRLELQASLKVMLDEASAIKQPLALLFINPDEFSLINQRLDRNKGDEALAQIAKKLVSSLRRSDALFRYGGAVFTALLPQTGSADTRKIAEKLRQSLTEQLLIGDIRLTFSIGFTVYQAEQSVDEVIDASEFLARADHALNRAKLSGGGCVVEYNLNEQALTTGNYDRLSGIFTADTEKDYRNIQLLWETISVISSISETRLIASEFVERIAATYKLKQVALFLGEDQQNRPRIIALVPRPAQDFGSADPLFQVKLTAQQITLLEKVKTTKRLERFKYSGGDELGRPPLFAYGFPLIARNNYIGCLYIDGVDNAAKLDSSDLIFLNALANQIVIALDRAELANQWKLEKERERQKLREEVRDLRQFMTNAKLIYRSGQMESILEIVRKLAPTDITVLITGESGTGKEVLAHTLHEFSERKNKSLITVDCGAISPSLIESELFGHVKGAFTGAQNASEGRIVQADQGTLFLDEVGELPLDVQAKLLRFVQEKQITPVGGTKTRIVDVRILAATNRNLAEEVSKGRFRGDLYFRFNVVTIKSPALRDRRDDILPLAIHFLEKFSIQYNRGNLRFSPEAERAMLDYPWPGNVRELQNTIIRAVVLSNGNIVDTENLQFAEKIIEPMAFDGQREQAKEANIQPVGGIKNLFNAFEPLALPTRKQAAFTDNEIGESWQKLQDGLARQVSETLAKGGTPFPLGKWLNEDLVVAANQAKHGNARQASMLLGQPETTFRRQIEKVNALLEAGLLSRTASWTLLQPLFNAIVAAIGEDNQQDILDQARVVLLEQVIAQVPRDQKKGSALMGVTGPTYRRWLQELGQR